MSVIITSYNEDEYLPEAIESCLSQSLKNIEIIIGDDGSDDNSSQIIGDYCNRYPEVIRTFTMERPEDEASIIPSLRHSAVIKRGLETAKGKYIAILDGDDWFCDDEKFSEAVKFLEDHDDHCAYVSGFKRVYQDGTEKFTYPPYYYCPAWLFWSGYYVHFSSFVFRKIIFDDGYFLNRFYADNGTVFALACAGKWKCTDKITFAYRQRSGSIVYTVPKMEYQVLHLAFLQDCLCSGRIKLSTYSRFYGSLKHVYEHRSEFDRDKCRKYLVSCEKYDNNVVAAFWNYNTDSKSRRYIHVLMLKCRLANLFLKYAGKFYRLPFRIIRKCRKILSRS